LYDNTSSSFRTERSYYRLSSVAKVVEAMRQRSFVRQAQSFV